MFWCVFYENASFKVDTLYECIDTIPWFRLVQSSIIRLASHAAYIAIKSENSPEVCMPRAAAILSLID